MGLPDRLRALRAALAPGPRLTGFPTSSNRASSFHLQWQLPRGTGPLRQVSTTLEILEPPSVPHLYFWALQASFVGDGGRRSGGAHLGLQWHRGHPDSRAANWGGYDARGRELPGSSSSLPSATGNPNTRDYPWEPGVAYRLAIRCAGEPSADVVPWTGEVTDLGSGRIDVVRELHVEGGLAIDAPVVWSEVFARCDDRSVVVRWSDFEATDAHGRVVRPEALVTNYQARADGGCDNTRSERAGQGVLQATNSDRTSGSGERIELS